MGQCLERTHGSRRCVELLLGNDLDDVDAIEVGENSGRELRLPRQAEPICSADFTSFHIRHSRLHHRNCCLPRRNCFRSTNHIQMCRTRTCSSSPA